MDGPDLPIAVFDHAIASINETVSILSGGTTPGIVASNQTFFYNHDTEIFTYGPPLLEGRMAHGSATIIDKVTKAKIPVVTGGSNSTKGVMDSTELLINGNWQTGTYTPSQSAPTILNYQVDLIFF